MKSEIRLQPAAAPLVKRRSPGSLCLFFAIPVLLAAAPVTLHAERAPLESTIDATPVDRLAPAPSSFAPIVDKAKGSVVHIFTTKKVQLGRGGPNMLNDPLFRFFFGDPQDPNSFRQMPPGGGGSGGNDEREIQAGMGSGVIISANGYILTNNHVIQDMDGVKVKLQNGNHDEYEATVVGADPDTDIALLKVEATNLPAVVLGDSTQIEVGDRVFAIGNPFGVGQTVTSGIISATSRTDVGITRYENFIQTDASINPGNSGGALIDMKGRLIGVNSAILSRSGGSQGIGLAVPVNLAWSVVNSLASDGKVNRGYLGVAISEVRADIAELYNLKGDGGALVTDVVRDTPAFAAGLRPGDVITHVNGVRVNHAGHLTNLIGQQVPGTATKLLVNRQGKELELSVNLGTRDEEALLAMQGQAPTPTPVGPPQPSPENEEGPLAGLQLADFDAAKGADLSGFRTPPPADLKGAIITRVAPGSAAQMKGLAAMDVIIEIDHKPVTSAEEARKLAAESKGKPLVRYWSAAEGSYGFLVLG